MIRYALRALGSSLFIVIGAVTVVFAIIRIAPGDQASVMLGPDATQSEVDQLRTELGLDAPLPVQYVIYLGRAVRLDFGESYRFGQPAIELVLERLPATVDLTMAAAIVAMIGLALGTVAGSWPGSRADRTISTFALALQSVPTFWVGIMLILVLSLKMHLFPSAGTGTPAHLVLPALTLAAPFVAIITRITRSSVAETVGEEYVLTARSKGLTQQQILQHHVFRNSSIPIITVIGLQLGSLLGGAVIVENVFAWPGLGSLLVSSVSNRDYAVVQAAALVISGIIVSLNLLLDLVYARLDPRIRLAR